MKLTFEEKKLLYTYGCADLELTRKRLYEIAGLTVDPNQNKLVYDFCRKLEDETLADWYDQMFYFVRAEMECYTNMLLLIPNGVNRPEVREAKLITDHFGLEKDSYILFLGRLVPEKGIRYLVEAFKNVKTDKKLVIAGGSSDTDSFMEELKELAKGDDRILFTGFVQGAMLDELYSNAYIYTLPSDLEGMPLSLLEAMSYGNCCLVSDIPECAEVVEDKALIFKKSNIIVKLNFAPRGSSTLSERVGRCFQSAG